MGRMKPRPSTPRLSLSIPHRSRKSMWLVTAADLPSGLAFQSPTAWGSRCGSSFRAASTSRSLFQSPTAWGSRCGRIWRWTGPASRPLSVPYRLGKSMWHATTPPSARTPRTFSPLPPGEVDVAGRAAQRASTIRVFQSPTAWGSRCGPAARGGRPRGSRLSVPYRLGKSMWPEGRAPGHHHDPLSVPYRLGKLMWPAPRWSRLVTRSFSPLPPGEVDVALTR